jgi:hypothetical protein
MNSIYSSYSRDCEHIRGLFYLVTIEGYPSCGIWLVDRSSPLPGYLVDRISAEDLAEPQRPTRGGRLSSPH